MAFPQMGTNSVARKQRVYYEGTSTIYEGMPVCYNYDVTTNVLGYSKSSAAIGTTTAEGYQNEGKFLRVEDVGNDGIMAFAGVVATDDYAGKTGPRWLDIYIPNGAIVPVRSGISTERWRTLLAICSGSDAFETPVYDPMSAVCAIAVETVDRATVEGLCLAQLYHPAEFNKGSQINDYESLVVGQGSTGQVQVFKDYTETNQTGGSFSQHVWGTRLAGNGSTGTYGACLCAETKIPAANDSYGSSCVAYICMTLDSGSTGATTAEVRGLRVRVAGAGTLAADGDVAPLQLETNLTDANGFQFMIQFAAEGTALPDALFDAKSRASIAAYASTGNAPVLATGDIMIPVFIAGTKYHLVAMVDTGL